MGRTRHGAVVAERWSRWPASAPTRTEICCKKEILRKFCSGRQGIRKTFSSTSIVWKSKLHSVWTALNNKTHSVTTAWRSNWITRRNNYRIKGNNAQQWKQLFSNL